MTSVGIMSMHRIFNYGSTLQGYSLKRLIEELDPASEVRFLDYEPGTPLIAPGVTGGRLSRARAKIKEYANVDARLIDKVRVINHKRVYGTKYLPMIGVDPSPSRDLAVDVQVIGSDEVFNCVQSNVNVGYSRDLFGHDTSAKRLISYAGSFGNTTVTKLDEYGIRDEVAADLNGFDAVSVRDANSQAIVAELTGRAPVIHLDPTLVYDLTADPKVPVERQYDGKYVIVYGYSGRLDAAENAAIRRYARSIGATILAFGGLQASADEFIDTDPFTLLAYFRDAEAIVTDTFHGTIFSIVNHRPFATFVRSSSGAGYGNEEKLGYLLNKLGLGARRVDTSENLDAILRSSIDYDAVDQIRAIEQASTIAYLSANLKAGAR